MLKLAEMTPEQKIGRVLCARRFADKDDIDFTLELIKNQACGCLQVPCKPQMQELVKKFREAADYPLLIINDMGNGFPLSSLPKVSLVSLAACKNHEYTKAFAAAIAKEAREAGYSGVWSPVVDIVLDDGPCKVVRCAGDSPMAVTEIAKDMLEVFDSYHFSGSAKHYPGADVGNVDTHMVEGVSYMTEQELIDDTLVPYFELMEAGLLRSIMVGHQRLVNIDAEYPASLSKKVIDIIRKRGFDGVAFTDSLAMMGILQKFGEAGAMALALMAGNDIILPNYRTPTRQVYQMMLDSYKKGDITDERLDEAVRRVMKLEEFCAKDAQNPYPVPENIEEILNNIARDSITAECENGASPAIGDNDKKRLFITVVDQDFDDGADISEISYTNWYNPKRVEEAIKKNFPTSDVVFMREYPAARDNERVLNMATAYDEVVFVTYCKSTAYSGTDGLTRRMESVINALIAPGKVKAVVHFGNPLVFKHLLPTERKIYGYIAPTAQIYAFEVLAGKIPAKGTLPFPNITKVK